MKKVISALILVILMVSCLLSCQQASSEIQSPNQPWADSMLKTYASRFDYFWNAMNSHYVFWDIDPTDWDAVYKTYMPEFEEIDRAVAAASEDEKDKAYRNAYRQAYLLYKELTKTLIDHHLYVYYFDPYRTGYNYWVKPSDPEIQSRNYYHPDETVEREETSGYYLANWAEKTEIVNYFAKGGAGSSADGYKTISNLMSDGETAVLYKEKYNPETGKGDAIKDGVVGSYCLAYDFTIDKKNSNSSDMHVIYLALSNYRVTEWIQAFTDSPDACPADPHDAFGWKAGKTLYSFFAAVRKYYDSKELAGVILDNRANGGGDNIDFEYIFGLYADQSLTYGYSKYKEGFGKKDYSAEVPMEFKLRTDLTDYYCNLESADIPYVVLCDLNSISCGETSTAAAAAMKNSYIIGERTYGATGPLLGSTDLLPYTYGGAFGDKTNGPIFCYTSTFNARTFTRDGYKNIEGIGFTPDKEIYFKSTGEGNLSRDVQAMYKSQVQEAFRYIAVY